MFSRTLKAIESLFGLFMALGMWWTVLDRPDIGTPKILVILMLWAGISFYNLMTTVFGDKK